LQGARRPLRRGGGGRRRDRLLRADGAVRRPRRELRLHVPRATDQARPPPGRYRGGRRAPQGQGRRRGALDLLRRLLLRRGAVVPAGGERARLFGRDRLLGWPLGLSRWPDRPRPIDAVPRYTCSVLSLFGGADPGIPQSAVDEFGAACRKAGVKHDSTVYPGAPHSFFDRKQTEFAEASADAWRRVQAFVR